MKTQPQVIIALFAASVQSAAVTSVTTTFATSLGCAECIRGGYLYNIDTTTAGLRDLITSGDYDGECCTDDTDTTNCPTSLASSGTLATNYVSVNPSGVDTDVALHACPTKSTYCGSSKELTFATSSDSEQTLTMSGTWTTKDQCTWLVKGTCGAPGIVIQNSESTDVTDTNVDIFYMEYNTASLTTFDSTDTSWPAYYTTGTTAQTCGVPDYTQTDTVDVQGQMPYFKQVTQVTPETYRNVPGVIVAEWIKTKNQEYADFDTAVTSYDVLRASYDTYAEEWNTLWYTKNATDASQTHTETTAYTWGLKDILDFFFGTGLFGIQEQLRPPVPVTPVAYSGPELYDSGTHSTVLSYLQTVETFGLGLLTADVLTMAGGGHAFGVLGEGTDTSLGAKFAAEDSSSCSASYFVVSVVPKAAGTGALSFAATVGTYEWGYDLDTPTAPSNATALVARLALPDGVNNWAWGYYGDNQLHAKDEGWG